MADRLTLILENLDLVPETAARVMRYHNFPEHITKDELVSDGYVGLIRAADSYRPGRSEFATFATYRIRGQMLDSLRDRDFVTRYARDRGNTQAMEQIHTETNDDGEDEEEDFEDIGCEMPSDAVQRELLYESMCVGLDERERLIVWLYYFDGQTDKQIGEIFGVTDSMVCQLRHRAIRYWRARFRRGELPILAA